jgi:hypothetical protein
MIETILAVLILAWPLWAVLGVLFVACLAEDIVHYRRRVVDNPTLW